MELFKDYYTREALVITHEQVFNIILTDKGLESSTKLHRELLTDGQSAAADKVKESTPQVAVSFRMEGGNMRCWWILMPRSPKSGCPRRNWNGCLRFSAPPTIRSWGMRASRAWGIMSSCRSVCPMASPSIWQVTDSVGKKSSSASTDTSIISIVYGAGTRWTGNVPTSIGCQG